MEIKLQCVCGTRFAFEVEPVNDRMPQEINCPGCGEDRTGLANEFIQKQLQASASARAVVRPPAQTGAHSPPQAPLPRPVVAPSASNATDRNNGTNGTRARLPRPVVASAAGAGVTSPPAPPATAGQAAPVYRQQKKVVAGQAGQKEMRIIMAAVLVIALIAGAWMWYLFVGSKPKVAFAQDFGRAKTSVLTRLLSPKEALVLNGNNLVLHNAVNGSDIWAVTLPNTGAPAKRESPSLFGEDYTLQPRLVVQPNDIWVAIGSRLTRINRQTGKVAKEINLPESIIGLCASEEAVLALSEGDAGKLKLTRISLQDGNLESEPVEGSSLLALAAGMARGAGVSAFGKFEPTIPIPAHRTDFMLADSDLLDVDIRLLEMRLIPYQAIKPNKTGSVLDDANLSAGRSTEATESLLNEMKAESGGGTDFEDQSRYQLIVRHHFPASEGPAVGEIVGTPSYFALDSVDVLFAGRSIIVFDKRGQKKWEAKMAYPLSERAILGFVDQAGAEQPALCPGKLVDFLVAKQRLQMVTRENGAWVEGMGREKRKPESAYFGPAEIMPCLEAGSSLICFDKGVLMAFELASGQVRWRLPMVGTTKVVRDGAGMLYVCTTSASVDAVQFTQQIKFTKKDHPVLLKVDPALGKVLWRADNVGDDCLVSGKFVYATRAQLSNLDLFVASQSDSSKIPTHFRIYRLNPKTGDRIWEVYRSDKPLHIEAQKNWVLLQFADKVEIIHFMTL